MKGIFHRISVRTYEDRPIEEEKINWMLKAAMAAPSAMNQQPWEYYVVTDPTIIEQLSGASPYTGCAKNAPVVFVPCYRQTLPSPDYALIDMSASVENLLLEADELGLGAVWMGIAPIKERMDKVKSILNLPDNLHAFALVPCGYPLNTHPQIDRYDPDRIHYI